MKKKHPQARDGESSLSDNDEEMKADLWAGAAEILHGEAGSHLGLDEF